MQRNHRCMDHPQDAAPQPPTKHASAGCAAGWRRRQVTPPTHMGGPGLRFLTANLVPSFLVPKRSAARSPLADFGGRLGIKAVSRRIKMGSPQWPQEQARKLSPAVCMKISMGKIVSPDFRATKSKLAWPAILVQRWHQFWHRLLARWSYSTGKWDPTCGPESGGRGLASKTEGPDPPCTTQAGGVPGVARLLGFASQPSLEAGSAGQQVVAPRQSPIRPRSNFEHPEKTRK